MAPRTFVNSDPVRLKRWVVWLLTASVTVSALLLLTWEPDPSRPLQSLDQVDSLITLNLNRFNIPSSQYRRNRIPIDSVRYRTEWNIDLPPQISRSHWHYELDRLLRPYGFETPARVHFPERDQKIYLAYGSNIVGTLSIQTRSGLIRFGTPVSLVLAFDTAPSPSRIASSLSSLNRPVAVAVRTREPAREGVAIREIRERHNPVLWWVTGTIPEENHSAAELPSFSELLDQIVREDSGGMVLLTANSMEQIRDEWSSNHSDHLYLIEEDNWHHLPLLSNRNRMEQTVDELITAPAESGPRLLLIDGTDANLERLPELLQLFNRQHIYLAPLTPEHPFHNPNETL
ncbi:MAG: hypothetical protein WDZ29_05115 [Balneolaceae bacterium]